MEEGHNNQDGSHAQPDPQLTAAASLPRTFNANRFPVVPFSVTSGHILLSIQGGNPMDHSSLGTTVHANNSSTMLWYPDPILPQPTSSTLVDLNKNCPEPLSLSLSLSLSLRQGQTSTKEPSCKIFTSFKNGDGAAVRVAWKTQN